MVEEFKFDLNKKFETYITEFSDGFNNKGGLFDCSIISFFLSNQVFNIPNFQRQFVWKERNIENFFRIFEDVMDEKSSTYFLGFFLFKESELDEVPKYSDEYHDFSVVDGQQRIMMTYVIFIVLKIVLSDLSIGINDAKEYDNIVNFINDKLLCDNTESGTKLKIRFGLDDQGIIIKKFALAEKLPSSEVVKEIGKLNPSLRLAFDYAYTWITGTTLINKKPNAGKDFLKFRYPISSNNINENLKSISCIFDVLIVISPSIKVTNKEHKDSNLFAALNSMNRPLTNFELTKNYLYSELRKFYTPNYIQNNIFGVIEKNCVYDSETLEQFFQIWYQDYFNMYHAKLGDHHIYWNTLKLLKKKNAFCKNKSQDLSNLNADHYEIFMSTINMTSEKDIEKFILDDVTSKMVTISNIINDLFIPKLNEKITTKSHPNQKVIDLTKELFVLRALNSNSSPQDYFDEAYKDETPSSSIKLNKSISPLVIRILIVYYSNNEILEAADLKKILKVTESYLVRRRVLHQKDGELKAMPTRFYDIFFKKRAFKKTKKIDETVWEEKGLSNYFDVYYFVLFNDIDDVGKKPHNWLAPTPETFKYLEASINKKISSKNERVHDFRELVSYTAPKSYNSKNSKEIKIFLMIEELINFDFNALSKVFNDNSSFTIEHIFAKSLDIFLEIVFLLKNEKNFLLWSKENYLPQNKMELFDFKSNASKEILTFQNEFSIKKNDLIDLEISSLFDITKSIIDGVIDYDEEIWKIGNLRLVDVDSNNALGSMPVEAKSIVMSNWTKDKLIGSDIVKSSDGVVSSATGFTIFKFSEINQKSIDMMNNILDKFAFFEKDKFL